MLAFNNKRLPQAILFAFAAVLAHTSAAQCDPKPGLTRFYSDGWGIELNNQRLQRDTTIDRTNVSRLKLAWSYGFANDKPRSWPLITEDTIFIGDTGVGVVALDRATGCTRWVHKHDGEIGSAILSARIGERDALLYLDRTKGLYAIDAVTGADIWQAQSADSVVPFYSGTPVIHDGVVYVPVVVVRSGSRADSVLRLLHHPRRHGGIRRAKRQTTLVSPHHRRTREEGGYALVLRRPIRTERRAGVGAPRCSTPSAASCSSAPARTTAARPPTPATRSSRWMRRPANDAGFTNSPKGMHTTSRATFPACPTAPTRAGPTSTSARRRFWCTTRRAARC